MASGRPVVAYASGGIPELIPPYGGVVAERKNPILLAKAIEMTMQGTASFNEASTIEWVRKNFSYQAIAQKLIKLFMAMVSSSS
jgi:glycosyltransferase involved in cell wall biosynthesis